MTANVRRKMFTTYEYHRLTELGIQKMEVMERKLAPFEKRFGMNSRDAWTAYQKGTLGDDGDIMEWMMLFENLLALQNQYERIREAGI